MKTIFDDRRINNSLNIENRRLQALRSIFKWFKFRMKSILLIKIYIILSSFDILICKKHTSLSKSIAN